MPTTRKCSPKYRYVVCLVPNHYLFVNSFASEYVLILDHWNFCCVRGILRRNALKDVSATLPYDSSKKRWYPVSTSLICVAMMVTRHEAGGCAMTVWYGMMCRVVPGCAELVMTHRACHQLEAATAASEMAISVVVVEVVVVQVVQVVVADFVLVEWVVVWSGHWSAWHLARKSCTKARWRSKGDLGRDLLGAFELDVALLVHVHLGTHMPICRARKHATTASALSHTQSLSARIALLSFLTNLCRRCARWDDALVRS